MRTLTLSLVAVVLVATIGLGWMFDNVYSQYASAEDEPQSDAISALEQVGENLALALNGLEQKAQFVAKWQNKNQYQLNLVSIDSFPMPQALINEVKSGQSLLLETDDSIALHFYLSSSQELLILHAPAQVSPQPTGLRNLILTSLFYVLMLVVVLLWLYPLAKRLLALRTTAKAFGDGDLTQRVNVGTISYISDLESEFNNMAQRIENLVSDVKLLSRAVSHDLRTPLARIRFGLDTLEEEDDPVMRRRFEQRISDNVDEMVELVETLLKYARLDQAMLELNQSNIELKPLIDSCVKNKSSDELTIAVDIIDQDTRILADPAYIMIMISNLLQNATQYCHSLVQVSLTQTADSVELSISDDGPGIAVEQREQILKPFIRGNGSEQQVKGYGMGLAIVKRILEWHQGDITISQDPVLQGAKISVRFPRSSLKAVRNRDSG
ncbi:ATP-binding protein [Psychrobium sp. 1_MG-2023]|uniref:ATP-binding protein n=1 Tax=Psychrobium sp. 1_MG-2023 TaxID=3062624 RepID=UPI000C329913|nr:ATP-binding protein [Psychrobium sp. 1_MG-2023]MDP2562926.1 ATP-binding protein [Psychrobium sp. 1_MG-2023]PKF54715.1 two-component sensor histidine kinase [Alteromonadales bacterium alter-6D02]